MIIDEYYVFGRLMKKPQKPTDQRKRIVEIACLPLIDSLKEKLTPIPDPHEFNHIVDIYGKWYRNQYHIYLSYKCPPDSIKDKFDSGLARIGWTGGNSYIVYSYFAHRNKWEALYENIPLDKAIERIKTGDYFSF